jgi:membrane protease YdiL (CAAX protease family)
MAVLLAGFHLLGCLAEGHISRLLWGVTVSLWLFCFLLMAAFPVAIARRQGVLRPISVRRMLKEFALAIPLMVVLVLAETLIVRLLAAALKAPVESQSSLTPLARAPNEPLLYLIVIPMFTLGPLAEELFFRGFLYNALRQRIMLPAAVLAQALVFSLIHYRTTYFSPVQIGVVFFMGCVLAGVYEWRKTLWAPIMLHSLVNFLFAGPVLLLMILNSHSPAGTWEEAAEPPAWLSKVLLPIEKQDSGEAQRLYAINSWGTEGLHLWKQDIRGMGAVLAWFPEDRTACAKAQAGIAMIYYGYLNDPRRAVFHADWVLREYSDQPESCARALLTIARAYAMLEDLPKSRAAYGEVLRSYASLPWAKQQAEEELKALDAQ